MGAFVDDPDDWRHAAKLERICDDICLVGLHPQKKKLMSLSGLLTGEALSIPYYRSRRLQSWVNEKLKRQDLSRAFAFSSSMAQYLLGVSSRTTRLVVDLVDMDSEKWRQYAEKKRWPLNWIYRREGETLHQFELKAVKASDASVFVSRAEAELFCRQAPGLREKVVYIRNGVDTEFFSPNRKYDNPYGSNERVLVFTGAMDYWANVDAVRWFSNEVFPIIQKRVPGARFFIVGARPTRDVRRLAAEPGIEVTGRVDDIRPYMAHARAAVAPLRLARGIQNKVLEAMAMARPVLATEAAVEGIDIANGLEHFVTKDREELGERGAELLEMNEKETASLGLKARRHVEEHYNWDSSKQKIARLLEGRPLPPGSGEHFLEQVEIANG